MPLKEVYLSLPEVEARLRSLESKYDFATSEFLRDAGFRARVSEDDSFEWEALIDHRSELRRIDVELRREYINRLTQPSAAELSDRPSGNDQLALAA